MFNKLTSYTTILDYLICHRQMKCFIAYIVALNDLHAGRRKAIYIKENIHYDRYYTCQNASNYNHVMILYRIFNKCHIKKLIKREWLEPIQWMHENGFGIARCVQSMFTDITTKHFDTYHKNAIIMYAMRSLDLEQMYNDDDTVIDPRKYLRNPVKKYNLVVKLRII